ncbi:MAG: hypothetical protein IH595_08060 [Bacteroidales bacterium]|nr:hypothetical protein [Bacteroidales bacterium]
MFHFDLAGEYFFNPSVEIPERSFYDFDAVGDDAIENLAFQIGMVELISYWKAACPPKVIIKCGHLTEHQIKWWKKLYFNGLGEFFYLNGIETDEETFMEISSEGKSFSVSDLQLSPKKVLVPIGGGKDSVVSLEILKNSEFQVLPYIVNPREASVRTIQIAGFNEQNSIILNRTLDKELLKLNELGFLNGHTPFSALLAFTSSLAALAAGAKYIALSNENSANQSTVPDSKINHQYSKSLEFENDFSEYLRQYVHNGLEYFSFLRPLNELQIAALFSEFPQHFKSFRSCNVGSKADKWCGHCPKCLFTYIILSPFVEKDTLRDIFGKDLLEDNSLEHVFKELSGLEEVKPFECVGTPEEVNAALWKSSSKFEKKSALAEEFINIYNNLSETDFNQLLQNLSTEHNLPESFFKLLNTAFHDREV